ncbi:MAG TPA: signal peptide peptidase SppA [Polyangiales bacterium]|nr:signal peptide peptidase SppA [Polyangiales bacterium]
MRLTCGSVPMLALLLIALCTSGVSAQFHRATDPVATPASVLVQRDDAGSIDVSPALLGFLPGFSLLYVHAELDERQSWLGQGDAISVASPLFFGLSLGATFQSIRPGPLARSSAERATFGVGLAYAPWKRFSMGVSGRGFYAGSDRFDGLSAVDIGFAWRAADWLGLSVSGRDLFASRSGFGTAGLDLGASLMFGWQVRPFGDNNLVMNFDVALDRDSRAGGRVGLGFRIPNFGQLNSLVELEHVGEDDQSLRVLAELSTSFEGFTIGGGIVTGDNFGDAPGAYGLVRFDELARPGVRPAGRVLDLELNAGGPREVLDVLLALDQAVRDERISAVLLRPRESGLGTAHAQELRMAIAALRGAGKHVICHLENATGTEYYGCAGADAVLIDPAGSIRLLGTSADLLMLGDTLRKVGLRADFVRIGEYKSAPEQFAHNALSEPARAELRILLSDVQARVVQDIASDLRVAPARVTEIMDDGPQLAPQAVHDKLVADAVDEVVLKGESKRFDGRAFTQQMPRRASEDWDSGPRIGVVLIDGTIVDGNNVDVPFLGIHMTGGRTATAAIDGLANDPMTSAIVVRVDSPGGAVLASDQIWRAIRRAREQKPVVVSMGAVAASGGYYVASAGDEIWADPSTLTGSIGIYYGKIDAAGLAQTLGVGVETFKIGKRAGAESLFRPFSPEERAALVERIRVYYRMFLSRVAAGRNRTVEQIDALGRGRVYSGDAALRLGLIDRLGGFASALARARQLGRVAADVPIVVVPARPGGLLDYVLGNARAKAEDTTPVVDLVPAELKAGFARAFALEQLGSTTPLALLPYDLSL